MPKSEEMLMKNVARKRERGALVLVAAFLFALLAYIYSVAAQSGVANPLNLPGQSTTLLPDGRVFVVGGEGHSGPLDTATIWDPKTGAVNPITNELREPRAWHSSTLLPDGNILIFGGRGTDGVVLGTAEVFNLESQTFGAIDVAGLVPRAHHTATLLTDGRILIAGGRGPVGETLGSAEVFHPLEPGSVIHLSLGASRQDHTTSLLPDGRVALTGGIGGTGAPLEVVELFDPQQQTFTSIPQSEFHISQSDSPFLETSLPLDGAADVATDSLIALRFSRPLRVDTVNAQTVALSGPNGLEQIKVVPAEGGMLAFITPESPLSPGATYSVVINGATDQSGLLLPLSGFSFTTQSPATGSYPSNKDSNNKDSKPEAKTKRSKSDSDPDDDWNWKGALKDGKPHSPWQDLPPLQADDGVTALAGQVLTLKGDPLANVTLVMEGMYGGETIKVLTDDTGRFLLKNIEPGWCEFIIDGRSASLPGRTYGVFEVGIEIKKGQTNILPYTIWMPRIDTAHALKISSPTISEIVVTSPHIPGLELRIPANTVIYDHEWKVVTEVSLTPIPVDRPPFPLPRNVDVPIYFTAQPGAAYIKTSSGIGARIHYPNLTNQLPGTRFHFWHYDPGYKGWYIYGLGTVPEDGKQVIPDPGISVYEFTGAMVGPPNLGPPEGAPPTDDDEDEEEDDKDDDPHDGEPVNLATGLFVSRKTDLFLSDAIPIKFTRTYRTRDTFSRAFGLGTSHSYDMFIVGDTFPYTFTEIVLPDGGRVRYTRTSPGGGFADAVYEHRAPDASCPTCVGSQTRFYGSRITWNGAGYELRLKDGTVYEFEEGFSATRPGQAGLIRLRDRNNNTVTISRDTAGNVTKVTSPNGRWIEFTNDTANNRVTQIRDNSGRTVTYEYDGSGRLFRATNPASGTTEYTYDSLHRMETIKDGRGIVFLTNEYDSVGNVMKQTLADTKTFLLSYTMNGSQITAANVTRPGGMIRAVTFSNKGYVTGNTMGFGTPEARTATYERQAGSSFKLFKTDALGRKTAFGYDPMGNRTSITRLADTPDAVITTFTYEPAFNGVASITDPLNHTTNFGYDSSGNLTTIEDPLGNQTTLQYNTAGQPISMTTPAGTTQFSYDAGDLVSVTDPIGNTTDRFIDAVGRLRSITNPLGFLTRYDYDGLDRLTKVTDPLAGITEFTYDENGNLRTVKDARNNVTEYTYDNMDRLETRKDPLLKVESYHYNANGSLDQFTDRKMQTTIYNYDALNRRTSATFGDGSTRTYTYDAENRLTQVADSVAGTVTRTYDGLNRVTSETTPQGSVSYTYDTASRRSTMTVAGQPTINYSYDNANRLTEITQGSSIVSFGYDNANRRTSLTLPNGILIEYAYDAASRVTGITYKQGANVLGDLTYEYDKAGNRTKIGGSWARTGLPQNLSTTNYDPANRQLTFADKTLTYDDNGNLTSIMDASGTIFYTWNVKNQLTGISGPGVSASFVYDGLGRREKRTINGSLTEFLFDADNPVQETSGAAVVANILTGLNVDEFLRRDDVAGTTAYFLTDALGSALALTDSAGVVQTEYTYEPFGKTTATGVSSTNPFQYTGRENDNTGLHYYRSRYYHPELQRFIAEDPIEFRGGDINLYGYVINNPTRFVDPFGLDLADDGFPSRMEHVYRNKYNVCPSSPPPNPTRGLRGPQGGRYDPESWNLPPWPWPEVFDSLNKYRSNKGNECKYGPDGTIIREGGSYNFEPDPISWNHFLKDMLPTGVYHDVNPPPGLTTVEY